MIAFTYSLDVTPVPIACLEDIIPLIARSEWEYSAYNLSFRFLKTDESGNDIYLVFYAGAGVVGYSNTAKIPFKILSMPLPKQ